MSISNRKPGQTKEAPAEPLKRAISGAMKAIARRPEMEIVFAADKPSLVGERARLPEPPRKLTPQDVAILRGHSDSMALRLACHDATVHRRAAPEGDAARAVFDAVEQSRVECVGSRRMSRHGRQHHRHARGPLSSRRAL
jgi:cobaltochelatase CobT